MEGDGRLDCDEEEGRKEGREKEDFQKIDRVCAETARFVELSLT
jgi:hypothetical protein